MHKIDSEIFSIRKAHLRVLEPVPCVLPFQDASMGPFDQFGIALLTLEDEEGNIGESPVYSSYLNILENCLLPILLNSPDMPYAEMYQKMYWSIRNEGFRGPAAALLGQIDLALHDLAARRCQLPLHKYLGATRNKVKFYGSGGGTNYSKAELEKEIMYFMDAGTDCYKMKVGKDSGNNIQTDIERVKFVRGLLGNNVKLAVDANQIWTNQQALEFVERCSGFDIAWIEEPVHSAAIDQIQEFCRSTSLQVSFGESERSSLVFPALLKAGVGHFQPVPTHLAGVREWMQVRDLAVSNNITMSSGGYSLFTSALVVTGSEDCYVEYLHTLMKGLESYFSVMPVIKGGMFELPDVVGLPVRVDWNYCERKNKIFRTRSWTSRNTGHYIPVVSV